VGRRNLTHKIASATVSIAATTTRNRSITTYKHQPTWGVCERPPNIVGKRRTSRHSLGISRCWRPKPRPEPKER
jgi:hypothetical protein